ncbi:MAG: hypothetical protein J7498_01240 [Sphingobium sp.]|nr:hypothetical protein [Sphingobium sp.]
MPPTSAAIPDIYRCCAIVLHHRRDWWLVEFPDRDTDPMRALPLGRMSGALVQSLRRRTGDATLSAEIGNLCPGRDCWCGDFTLIRSKDREDRFDILEAPWKARPGELETRHARAIVDTTVFPIPPGFTSVFESLPPINVPVLAIRVSG